MGTMQDYLDRLPDGLASYPECRSKAGFLRSRLASLPPGFDLAALPDELREIVTNPAPASLFMPSVHGFAFNHALLDSFADAGQFLDYSLEHNRKSVDSPMYRILFAVASPKMVLKRSAITWARIHDGIPLESITNEDNTFTNKVSFPPHLVFPEMLEGWAKAFAYTIGLAGGKNVQVDITEQSTTSAVYDGRWS